MKTFSSSLKKKLMVGFFFFSVFLVHINADAQTVQSHNKVPFQTGDGIYGYAEIHTKPGTFGESYIVIDAKSMIIEGVRGGGEYSGITFPMAVSKYTLDIKGSGCMRLNSHTPDCGNFSMRSLGATASDYTTVHFSDNAREKHNAIRKETGEGYWQTRGYIQSIEITSARSDVFNEIKKAKNTSAAAENTIAGSYKNDTDNTPAADKASEQTALQQQHETEQQQQTEKQRRNTEMERKRRAEAQERRRKAAEERRRRAAAEQTRNDLGNLSSDVLHSGGAVGLSMTGNQFGLSIGGIMEKGAFLFNIGTDELAVITGEEFTVENPVLSMGVDVGINVADTQALMMYVGAFMDFQTAEGRDDEFGVSGGIMGLLGGAVFYQAGYRYNSDTENANFFGSLGLQLNI